MADTIGSLTRGSLCLYLESDQDCYILPDPLGTALLYEYRSDNIIAYSSDLESLIDAVILHGEQPKKRFCYLVEVIFAGNGGFFPASYKDVDSLPPFSFITATHAGFLHKKYKAADEFLNRPSNLDTLFEEARSDLLSNVKAVANADVENHLSHLTGGFDSRLVLSALMHTKNHQKFRFMCSETHQVSDLKVAGDLCGHLGLTLTNSDGTISSPFSPGQAMIATSGMLSSNMLDSALPSHVLMAGGYGECLRSAYGAKNSDCDSADLAMGALYGKTFTNESARLIGDSFYRSFRGKFEEFFSAAADAGAPKDAMLDYLYVVKRARYHFGLNSQYHSNFSPRIDPIYSVSAMRLGLFTPLAERIQNVQGLKLMASLSPELVSLPFDSDKITPAYEARHGIVSRSSFNGQAPRIP